LDVAIRRLAHSVRGIANWILDYAESVGFRHTNMGVNKLTFFALEAFLLARKELLTDAKIEAWEHGPVFRELYQSFKSYGNGYIDGRARYFDPKTEDFRLAILDLSTEEEAFLKEKLFPLIRLNASELRALSHRKDSAWYQVWWYEGHANPGMEITPQLLLETEGGRLS
jgi:uncharacterized phage-associated protein